MSRHGNGNTKSAILDSAEVLFAKGGFRGTSIRAITDAANCNTASVNYHFSNKENLYLEVFLSRWLPREKAVIQDFEKELQDLAHPTPSAIFRALAKAYIDGPLSNTERQRQRLLVVQEIANQGQAFELIMEQINYPLVETVLKHLKPYIKKGISSQDITIHILGLFGMIYYFTYSRIVVSQILNKEYDDKFKKGLIDHIADSFMNGISPLLKATGRTKGS